MNRIEHVATPTSTPARQPQPRFPRSLADVRRRASPARAQPTSSSQASARARRGTSGLAVAIAALAVPLIPNPALGAAVSTGSTPEAPQAQTQTRHHLPHGHVLPEPGALTVQAWSTASGWTLTVPTRPADADLWDHVPTMRHDGGYVAWPAEAVAPIDRPRPVVLPDGTHGEISAYRVSRANPRADSPDAPGTQTPADPVGPDGSTSSAPSGDAPPESSSGGPGPSALRNARSRVVPGPLIPVAANAVANTAVSPCLGATHPANNDPYMLARLRPASDAMNVVVTPHRVACAARVDYLSQARA